MQLKEIVGMTYGAGVSVVLDNLAYRGCTFKSGCKITYYGGPSRIENCQIDPGVVWDFQASAAYVWSVLSDLGFQVYPPGALARE